MTCLDALSLSFKSIISPVIVFRMVKGRGGSKIFSNGMCRYSKKSKILSTFFLG